MVMPATAFGRIVNRVLFPIMSQVQDERGRLGNAYERALAIVALVSLPVSAFLLVVAPEFIPVILGPAWTEVVVPFRLFTISLLFRMSSKISDACTKAAGEVYLRALLQGAFAVAVVVGALIGKQWGIGGVAVAVSVAMGLNFLSMAALSRSVTDLPWSHFARAHLPGALLAAMIGAAVFPVAMAGRAAQLGNIPILLASGLAAAAVVYACSRLRPELFLGPHGAWAFQRGSEFLRSRPDSFGRRGVATDSLASAGKANSQ
jgi:PST family polysaccharide transporter